MSHNPYPAYQDSGIEWVGRIPAAWTTKPTFAVARESKRINVDGGEDNVLSLSYGQVVQRDIERMFGLLPESFGTYQIVEPNNIILRLTDLQNDKRSLRVGLVRERGIITAAYQCIVVNGQLNPRYAFYLLHDYDLRKVFYGMGSGVRQSMGYVDLRRMPLLVPSHAEQTAIADFLDRETVKIDTLIDKQEQLIKLLEEKRHAVISHAVTRGLNSDVRMKVSGVEWLGEVPEHWTVGKIKYFAKMESGHTPDKKVEAYWADCDIPWVSLNDSKTLAKVDYIHQTQYSVNALGIKNSSARLLPASAVVFTRDASIGLSAITTKPMAVSQHLIAWLCRPGMVVPEYLLLVFYGMASVFDKYTFGATIKTIGMDDVRALCAAFPPIAEQEDIVAHVFAIKEKIDSAVGQSQQLVMLLKERRTALISAAVTGKIDVRNVAQPKDRLP